MAVSAWHNAAWQAGFSEGNDRNKPFRTPLDKASYDDYCAGFDKGREAMSEPLLRRDGEPAEDTKGAVRIITCR